MVRRTLYILAVGFVLLRAFPACTGGQASDDLNPQPLPPSAPPENGADNGDKNSGTTTGGGSSSSASSSGFGGSTSSGSSSSSSSGTVPADIDGGADADAEVGGDH